MERIPFNRPSIVGKERSYIDDVLRRQHLSGDGHYTKACHRWLEERFGFKKVLLTTSATHAMELAGLLYELEEGDEFILPSYTFVSTVNAFVLRGAKPIFVDIDPETLNIDPEQIESHLTERTKLIVPVHYAGVSCDMDRVKAIAEHHDLFLFEDAAQAIAAKWNGRYLGRFGSMATFSFHETKNIVAGEGGALLINDERFIERAEFLREKGTNRSQFLRGAVDKYTWIDVGSSYLPPELTAAYLLAQLEALDNIQRRRRELFLQYQKGLQLLENKGFLRLPVLPKKSEPNFHIFFLLLENEETSDRLMAFLRERGIQAVFHFQPLHLSKMGQRYGYQKGDFPVTEDLAPRLLRLPLFYSLTDEQQYRVIEAIHQFYER